MVLTIYHKLMKTDQIRTTQIHKMGEKSLITTPETKSAEVSTKTDLGSDCLFSRVVGYI